MNITKTRLSVALIVISIIAGSYLVSAQDKDSSKGITADVFIQNRAGAQKKSTGRYKPAVKVPTNVSTTTPPPGKVFADVGVTLWRFRRSTAADKTKELIEEDDSGPAEWTLERIDDTTPLSLNQKVRLSIESLSKSGYLYVIDREQYGDGTLGDPYLIFPTQKTRDANYVKAGKLIYIPSATGKFRIQFSNGPKRPVGEMVTMVVSSKPLVDPDRLEPTRIRLARADVEAWEKDWKAIPLKLDLEGGLGQSMTEKEQSAGASPSLQLTQDDPPPQTVYRLAIKPENPVVLSVLLRFRT